MPAPITWFCVWQPPQPASPSAADAARLTELARACPGMSAVHVLVPAAAHDPYFAGKGGSPALILQLDCEDIVALEDQLQSGGHLAPLAERQFLPSLRGVLPQQQALLVRRFAVPQPRSWRDGATALSYWVEYTGPAQDENAWHGFYLASHAPLLTRLPGIRMVEIYTPAIAVCGIGLAVRPCMQRNKTVFDDAEAMNAAMQSPLRAQLREDVARFPPFSGEAHHFPFISTSYFSARGSGTAA